MDILGVFDRDALAVDWQLVNGDLARDGGLETAVLLSLFTDATADADDELPDGTGDRRGWWGDLPLDPPVGSALGDRIGSKLWLRVREKQIQPVLTTLIGDAAQALAWLRADGIAEQVGVTGRFPRLSWVELSPVIARRGPNGQVTDTRFDTVRDMTFAGTPARPQPVAADDDGTIVTTDDGQEVAVR